jgi:hypothetical protein
VKLPAPGPRDTCPVCGMFVAPYPYWIATVLWRDGQAVHFDGAKDFFKYLLDLKKYEPRRSRADIQAMGVTDYYGAERIAAQTRGLRDRLRRAGADGARTGAARQRRRSTRVHAGPPGPACAALR